MKTSIIIIVLLVPFGIVKVHSQTTWVPMNGPYGGPVYELMTGTQQYDFCITPAGIFRTSNAGDVWNQCTSLDMQNLYVGDIDDNGFIYAGTSSYTTKLYRSTDQGDSWMQVLDGGLDFNAVAASSNGNVFAGTFYMFSFHGQFIQNGEIFRSVNGGSSWTSLNFSSLAIRALETSSANHLFVATTEGIHKSVNNGASFSLIRSGSVIKIFINSLDHIFIHTVGNTVYRSLDGGSSWTMISSGDEVKMPSAQDASGNLYAPVSGNIYKSIDNGLNWSLFGQLTSNSFHQISSISFRHGNVYVTSSNGIFRSTNNGSSWDRVQNGIRDPNVNVIEVKGNNIYTSSYSGIFRSTDNGQSWIQPSNGLPEFYALDIKTGSSEIVFANIVTQGLYRSADNGDSWARIQEFPQETNISSLETGAGNDVFVATADGFIHKSPDNGGNWSKVSGNLPDSLQIQCLATDSNGKLYASVVSSNWFNFITKIYRMESDGNWIELNSVYAPEKIEFGSTGVMHIKNGTTMLHSLDGGLNFVPTTSSEKYVLEFAVNNIGHVVVSCVVNEIYRVERTTDNGVTWTDLTGIMSNQHIYELAIDVNSHIIAGTQSGVYRTSSPTHVSTGTVELAQEFQLKQNYPNPFNPSTKIGFVLPSAGNVKIDVFDVSGRLVTNVLDRKFDEGSHDIEFNGRDLSSGVYFYKLEFKNSSRVRRMMLLK